MTNLPGIPSGNQTLVQNVSEAITSHILSDAEALRAEDGAGLSALLDEAILTGVEQSFRAMAQAHATAVLGAERSARLNGRSGYRSGQRSVRIGSPIGLLTIPLVKSRQGVLRPGFLQNAGRFTEGVKQLASSFVTTPKDDSNSRTMVPQFRSSSVMWPLIH